MTATKDKDKKQNKKEPGTGGQAPALVPDARYSEEFDKLPSGLGPDKVTIMEMTTREESLLTRPKKLRDGSAIESILQSCTHEELPISDLLLPDRHWLMVQIRRITYGGDYAFPQRCPSCGATGHYNVDLGKLPFKRLKEAHDHVYELTLPRCGKVVQWQHIRGKDERVLLAARRGTDDDALIPVSLRLHAVSVDGEERFGDFFEHLGGMDSQAFREHIAANTCGLETMIECSCQSCEFEFEVDMPIGADFFWPSAARKH